jgi:isopentenyl phosphate kinase
MIVFLKLGGSLITDKGQPYTSRPDRLKDIASQIASSLKQDSSLKLILGHGSGSFGHEAARLHDTRSGVKGSEAWLAFAEVWYQASRLNRIVVDTLHHAGLPTITVSPASSVIAHDGKPFRWDTTPIRNALENGLLPVIHGDVAFDDVRGGTILSTEDLFAHLAGIFHPERILLAGLELGVWADFPERKVLIPELTPAGFSGCLPGNGRAEGSDVTGGMQSKVSSMLALVEEHPGLDVFIFSGELPQAIFRLLQGEASGTRLHR